MFMKKQPSPVTNPASQSGFQRAERAVDGRLARWPRVGRRRRGQGVPG